MNLELLTDKSHDNVEYLVSKLDIGHDTIDRIRTILCKAKNLYLITDADKLYGFINLKHDSDKKVTFCPIHLKSNLNNTEMDEVVTRIKVLSKDYDSEFLVLIDIFKTIDWTGYCVYNEPWDRYISMSLDIGDLEELIPQKSETEFKIENLKYEELLDLHIKSYISEPIYVIGEWQQLLEQFFTFQTHTIVSCRLNNELIGACIGYLTEKNHYIYSICILPEYTGKQIGYQLLHYYLTIAKSDFYNLNVLHSNTKARALYEKTGFKTISRNNLVYKITQ